MEKFHSFLELISIPLCVCVCVCVRVCTIPSLPFICDEHLGHTFYILVLSILNFI